MYRSLLAGKQMLIVLDNARDEQQVRPLLPASPASLVIVTSRSQLSGLAATDGARLIRLDVLTHDEAVQLLTARLGSHRAQAEPAAVGEIASLCAHLPLALAIAAARAATRPGFALAALATELRDAADRLDVLDADDPAASVRAVFSWSYRQLTDQAARMFRLLGLHPGPDITVPAATSLAGTGEPDAVHLLRALTRTHLITEHRPGRYAFHDLLHSYAADQARAVDSDAEHAAIIGRVLDHYLHSAYTAALLLAQPYDPLTLSPAQPGVTPERLAGKEQAMGWFSVEYRVLLAAIGHAATAGYETHAWQLTWTVSTFLDRQGHWHDYAAAGRSAVSAADRLADPAVQAWARRTLARAYTRLNRFEDADAQLRDALSLSEQSADQAAQADTRHYQAILFWRWNRLETALEHARQFLELSRAVGHRGRLAGALNGVGWFQALLGDPQSALDSCGQALVIYTDLGDLYGQANTWDSLGYAHHQLGHHAQAMACYRNALTLVRYPGDRYLEADTLASLADVHLTTGELPQARQAWQQALAIYDDLQHPDADKVRAKLASTEE